MNFAAALPRTLANFPPWEHGRNAGLELDRAEPAAVNGGSLRHTRIALSMAVALDKRLDFTRYEVVRGDAKIIANGHVRYPDIVVYSHDGDFGPDMGGDLVHNPVVVVEVLSRSTRRVDQFDKNVDYAATPTIQHYVMLSQQRRYAIVCSRTGQGWAAKELDHAEEMELTALGISIPFSEVYRRIAFGEDYF